MAQTPTFGELLRRHRLAAGLTQEALAERSGTAGRTIQDLERGTAQPRRATASRLAAALALPPAARSELEMASPSPRRRTRDARVSGPDGPHWRPGIWSDQPLDARPNNLPVHPTVLLGRERELGGVQALLRDGTRLVTLTGPGGVGKTRLGMAVAAELLDDFDDGVFLVELAPVSEASLVASSIAQVLGVRDMGGSSMLDLVRGYLRPRTLLLVLDNFEQILSSAPLVADLLAASPGLKVLVTSREPLRLRGEQEYAVPPLALPDAQRPITPESVSRSSAVALFVQRATAIRPDFAVGSDDAPAIAEICARVDALPLAIELAAARVRLLTPRAMVQRLERRLPLLVGGARDLPARQQTLRDTIAWSHDLLDEQDRRLLPRLAVFVGGWTLDAADAVCNVDGHLDVLGSVESLVAKSLVKRADDDRDEQRFGMLETIREYGLERLDASGEAGLIRSRHAAYLLALAEEAAPRLLGTEQRVWLRRLDAAHDDLRAALRWSLGDQIDAGVGLRLVGALPMFWFFRGFAAEGHGWATAHLARPDGAAPTVSRARALKSACVTANMLEDYAAQHEWGQESAAIFQQVGDLEGTGRALAEQAVARANLGTPDAGRPLLEASAALAREAGDRWGLAFALGQLASTWRLTGDYATARAHCEESAAIAREIGDRFTLGLALCGIARGAQLQGDWQESTARFKEALVVSAELEDPLLVPRALAGLGSAAVLAAEYDRAARLLGSAEVALEASGRLESSLARAINDRDASTAHVAMGDEAFARAWDQGRAMTLEQAVAYALEAPDSTR